MKTILIAGATGYLGRYIPRECQDRNYFTKVVDRNLKKFEAAKLTINQVLTHNPIPEIASSVL
jgi:nucleoside-diphosphate-sugar epimerase